MPGNFSGNSNSSRKLKEQTNNIYKELLTLAKTFGSSVENCFSFEWKVRFFIMEVFKSLNLGDHAHLEVDGELSIVYGDKLKKPDFVLKQGKKVIFVVELKKMHPTSRLMEEAVS